MLSVQLSIIKLVFRNPCVVKARFCPLDKSDPAGCGSCCQKRRRELFQRPRPLLCRRRSSESFKVSRFESLPAACPFRACAVDKEKILENFVNVIARCVLRSGRCTSLLQTSRVVLSRDSGRESCLRGRLSDRC